MKERISVFGLGKLGSTMLACFAHKGWDVIGVDVNENFVNKINIAESPIYEPRVDELIKANKERITATLDYEYAIINSDISFIIVPTPSIADGSFTTKYVEVVVAEIGSILRSKDKYHTVVVTSTVLPGDMMLIKELLERTSGKKCGDSFGLCFNPDFIALGSIVKDFLNPDMILIGESDKKAGDHLEEIHKSLVESNPTIHRMNFYNAELTKIALNSFCTLKITFANTIAELCEKMPGGNADEVTSALGADSRIGKKYIKGGLSYGGPCFPRDNRALSHAAERFGCKTPLAQLTDELNDYHRNTRIPEKILALLKKKNTDKLSILGLTYKKDTTLVEESAAISIIKSLIKENVKIKVYDPAGMDEAKIELEDYGNIEFSKSTEACVENSEIVFIASPWDEFKNLSEDFFIQSMKEKPVIFDAWSIYPFENSKNLQYIEIGKAF